MKKTIAVLAASVLVTFFIVVGVFRYNDAKARQEFNEQRAKDCRDREEAIQDKLNAQNSAEKEAQLKRDLDKVRHQCADLLSASTRH